MSFTDLMSSGRGPGVIGMVMALFVLVGFGILFVFAFDEGMQGGDQTIESVIRKQGDEIGTLQASIDEGNKKLATAPELARSARELATLSSGLKSGARQLETLAQSREAVNSALAALVSEFDSYKDRYRTHVRNKAKGSTMDELKTNRGDVYKNVSIREVTPIGIQIRHDEGQKRIAFEDLPDEMVDYYQFDPSQKAAALLAEQELRSDHEAAAEVANEAAEQEMGRQRAKENEEKKDRIRVQIAGKMAEVESLNNDIKSLRSDVDRASQEAAAARAAGRMHINRSSSIEGNIRSKQNRIATILAEVGRLRSQVD